MEAIETFLDKSAKYIFSQHPISQLQNICVVLPTRRAAFYLKRSIAKVADKPFLSPEVFAIDDFVMKMSGVNQIDSVSLLFELYATFKEFDPSIHFDKFISWASTLLRDFDLIDQYMVENPKALFEYMSEARAMERWQLMLPENQNLEKTQTIDKYFSLFDNINNVYNSLRDKLSRETLSYRGMAYKTFADDIKQLLSENQIFEKYYFVGFNALSISEEKIIETLVKANKAEVLWDADNYLVDSKFSHKAGKLLRKYKSSGKYGIWKWQTDHLLTEEKIINIYAAENNTLQAKIAGKIYGDELKKNPDVSTAIVLCDEELLNPVLYSLDSHINDFNITMGLSLRGSSLFTLIDAIFELQQNIVEFKRKDGGSIKIPKYSHRHISKVLNHPLIRPILKNQNQSESVIDYIVRTNTVFLDEKEILELGKNEKIYKVLFTRWGEDASKATKSFYLLIDELREIYKNTQDSIEVEYLYLFLTILNRLEKILFSNKEFNLKSFKHFLYELVKQERIPFSGEPIANLQIMGMLETRCLDFERVIFLSVNEGIIPVGKKVNSLIPYDAAKTFGLPIHSDQDAVMSYHFFRLLERAKEVDIIYVLPTGDGVGGGGEKSRFILQIENELQPANPKIKINYPSLVFDEVADNQSLNNIVITKDTNIIQTIETQLSQKGIYPTHLTEYLSCSLKYYFSKIAKVSKIEEIDEKFGADIFGTWLHDVLEKIDEEFKPHITKEDIEKIIESIPQRLETSYQEKFGGFVIDNGMNYLLKHVGEQLLKDFFKNQLEIQIFPIEVVGTEEEIIVNLEFENLGKIQNIKIAGRVDRVEREGNILKVIDYKTGKVSIKDLKPSSNQSIEEAILDPSKDKFRQLWLYQYLMLKKMNDDKNLKIGNQNFLSHQVRAKIYSFRNIKENLEVNLSFNENPSISGFIEKSEEILKNISANILNPTIPFTQTEDLDICVNCDFKGICGR